MAVSSKKSDTINIEPLDYGLIKLRLIGTTGLYFHAMGGKAWRDLLTGGNKKTAAQRKRDGEIKHDVEREFRDSIYKKRTGDTYLCFPVGALKQAMATAALETAGIQKTSVQRLVSIPENEVQIWGQPYMKMDAVRSADMSKTADIRTRAYLPRWCSEVTIRYVRPTLNARSVASLLQNAGTLVGIGDFRQEKGRGGYGTWVVTGTDDMGQWQDDWDQITKEGREIQESAMQHPVCADELSQELYEHFKEEVIRRADAA
tara:strand:- start:13 stop:789 length:777 start_codon:yes stop_codon:yes gene_type:complete